MVLHREIRLYGLVQGVGLRAAIRRQARELGITGFVKNEPEGTVYLEMEGEKEALEKLKSWFLRGDHVAEITKAEINEGPIQNFPDFSIR